MFSCKITHLVLNNNQSPTKFHGIYNQIYNICISRGMYF